MKSKQKSSKNILKNQSFDSINDLKNGLHLKHGPGEYNIWFSNIVMRVDEQSDKLARIFELAEKSIKH